VKQSRNTANFLIKKSINPAQTKGLILSFLLAIGSTAVLAGCNKTPTDSASPDGSSSPATSSSPGTSSSSAASSSPASSTSPAASSSSNTSDVKKVEAALKNLYTEKAGVPIESVNCPDNANIKPGGSFECKATTQGVKFDLAVKMENSEGSFNSNTKGLIVLSKIEDLLKQTAKEKANIDLTADCGGKVRQAKAGDTFNCKVQSKDGKTGNAKITVKDEQGNINVKL